MADDDAFLVMKEEADLNLQAGEQGAACDYLVAADTADVEEEGVCFVVAAAGLDDPSR